MIESSLNELTPVYLELFNTVFDLRTMPQTWCHGLITPIFKCGAKSDPSTFVLDVPVGERRKFDRYTEHSPTEDMFNYLADVWKPDLKVKDLKRELKDIYRNDVIQSLNEGMQTSAVLFLLPVVCYLSGSLCYRSFTVLTNRGHPCLWNFPVALRNKLIFPRQTTNKTYRTQTIATNLIINKETEIRQNYK